MTIVHGDLVVWCQGQKKVSIESLWHHWRCDPVSKVGESVASEPQVLLRHELQYGQLTLIEPLPVGLEFCEPVAIQQFNGSSRASQQNAAFLE